MHLRRAWPAQISKKDVEFVQLSRRWVPTCDQTETSLDKIRIWLEFWSPGTYRASLFCGQVLADGGQIFEEQVGCHVTISAFDLFPAYCIEAVILISTFRSDVLINFKLGVDGLATLKKVVD